MLVVYRIIIICKTFFRTKIIARIQNNANFGALFYLLFWLQTLLFFLYILNALYFFSILIFLACDLA